MMTALKLFGILVLIYGVLVLMLVGCQRKMMYFPSNAPEEQLMEEARGKGISAWRNAEGELIGWKASTPENSNGGNDGGNAVVVFHGNAGYALHRDYIIGGFLALAGQKSWTVHVFEYPGYGARPGQPSEQRIKAAAGEAVAGLFNAGYDRLYLVGESLGTGVATHLADRFSQHIDGLLLITPFTSLVDVGRKHYPIFPIGMLLRDRFDNLEPLEGYAGPVAFLIAGADEVVSASLGHNLYQAYSGPKHVWVQEGRGHNTLNYHPRASWWQEVVTFLQKQAGTVNR
jgi:hypothetical protein